MALVPAFAKCTAPNRLHGPPALGGAASDASCAPPAQATSFLTIGAPDANGAPSNSVGSIRFGVVGGPGPPEDSDVLVAISVTDVRCRTGVATCGAVNNQAGPDYTGELTPNAAIRVTDNFNAVAAGGGTDSAHRPGLPARGEDPGSLHVYRVDDGGSDVRAVDDARRDLAGHSARRQARVWQVGQVEVLDGGSDGEATTAPNSRFLVQGVFVP